MSGQLHAFTYRLTVPRAKREKFSSTASETVRRMPTLSNNCKCISGILSAYGENDDWSYSRLRDIFGYVDFGKDTSLNGVSMVWAARRNGMKKMPLSGNVPMCTYSDLFNFEKYRTLKTTMTIKSVQCIQTSLKFADTKKLILKGHKDYCIGYNTAAELATNIFVVWWFFIYLFRKKALENLERKSLK